MEMIILVLMFYLHKLGKIDALSEPFYVDRRVFISVVMCVAFRTCPFPDIQVKILTAFQDMAAVTARLRRVFQRLFSQKPATEVTLDSHVNYFTAC